MATNGTAALIEQLSAIDTQFFNRDFLLTWNHTAEELQAVLLAAEALEQLWAANISTRVFDGGLAVSNFRDQSTRTRFSFASAASLLGLTCSDLDESKSQIAHGETVRETANMISFLTEVIGIRDDMYLGAGHKYMVEVSAAVDEGFREGVLPQRPGVVNLQCDLDHPTQSMADLLHLQKTFGSLENLRGKKLAMTWAYSPSYGKPLSVPQGIITLMTRFGMHVSLAHPEGYDLVPDTLDTAAGFADESGGSFEITHSMDAAFHEADVVYPKSWAPMSVMQRRTELLRAGDKTGLGALENECLANNAKHLDWECTQEKMKLTNQDREGTLGPAGEHAPPAANAGARILSRTESGALYMHCLPADITGVSCAAGEVAETVFERYRLPTYHEASHKPYVIAAMMLLTRFESVADVLKGVLDRATPRRNG
jgi:knotted carbamoyltransferase YgeW